MMDEMQTIRALVSLKEAWYLMDDGLHDTDIDKIKQIRWKLFKQLTQNTKEAYKKAEKTYFEKRYGEEAMDEARKKFEYACSQV